MISSSLLGTETKPSPCFTGNSQLSSISGFHLSVPREVTGESPKCPEVPFGVWSIIWNQNGHRQVFEWASLLSCFIWRVKVSKSQENLESYSLQKHQSKILPVSRAGIPNFLWSRT